jgi:hypothetical protein
VRRNYSRKKINCQAFCVTILNALAHFELKWGEIHPCACKINV